MADAFLNQALYEDAVHDLVRRIALSLDVTFRGCTGRQLKNPAR